MKSVVAGNFVHSAAANSVLYVWRAEGMLHLAEPDLFGTAMGPVPAPAAVLNDCGA